MTKVYERTENGVTKVVSKREGLDEINHAMMAGKHAVRTMSSITRTDFAIEYKDGQSVRLVQVDAVCGNQIKYGKNVCVREDGHIGPHRDTEASEAHAFRWFDNEGTPAEETDSEGRQIITVKGKRYVVSTITPARPRAEGATFWIPRAYVTYWSERNGETFGPTRSTNGDAKPGTVGRAIWDEVNR